MSLTESAEAAIARREDAEFQTVWQAVQKVGPAVVGRMVRAALYTFAAALLVVIQPTVSVSVGLPAVIFVLALPKRSVWIAEMTLAALVVLLFIPAGWLRLLG